MNYGYTEDWLHREDARDLRPMDVALCRMEALETFAEILDVLTPKQTVAVALRYEGYNDVEISELLGVSHQAVACRVDYAGRRIARELPHLAPAIEGRTLESSNLVYRRDPKED